MIRTAEELAALAAQVNNETEPVGRYYKLLADIDLSAYGAGYNGGLDWTLIGDYRDNAFKGHFDGNEKTIAGLYIDGTSGEEPRIADCLPILCKAR